MEKGREGRDSGSEVWGGGKGGTAKEVVVTSMGLGGGGQEKKTELGGELGKEEGCIRLQDSSEQCQNALQCMFVKLPLPRRQYSCSGTVPDM